MFKSSINPRVFLQRVFKKKLALPGLRNFNSGPWGGGDGDNPWGRSGNGGESKKPTRGFGEGETKDEQDPFKRFRSHYDKAKKNWNNDGGNNGNGGGFDIKNLSPKKMFFLITAAIIIAWLVSGFYAVNAREEGIVMRFGAYVRTASPGLNYHLPNPIETVQILRVQDRYKEDIGYRNSNENLKRRSNNPTDQELAREILMLTGDENLVAVNLEVQWQISDGKKYLFNVFDPKKTVRDSAESALREIVGMNKINYILSEGRTAVQLQTKQLLQHMLDSYDAGIEISEINMRAVPPQQVADAFKDVQAAKINKEEMINKAITYRNGIVPKAQGEAERFISVYKQYSQAKDVTRTRMYLETMEDVMKGMNKIIIDNKNSPITYMNLPSLSATNQNNKEAK